MVLSHRLAEPLEAYLVYLEGSRGYAVHTRAQYQRQLYSLAAALENQGLTHWSALSSSAVENLLLSWRRQQVGIPSIHQRLAALRSFCDYLCEQGQLSSNPAKLIKAPKAKRRLPKNMDVDGVAYLLEKDPSNDLEVRDRAMFELIYSAGLRVSELVSLNVSDLPTGVNAERQLRVTGKGSKTRIVPYGREAQRWLEQWLQARQGWPQQDPDALFVGQRGTRLSVRSVQLRLKQWGLERGSAENLHPHKLRHSFASHMLESSGDLRAVQELLGHANLSTTQVYTHLDFQHLAGVYDKTHPRAKKKP